MNVLIVNSWDRFWAMGEGSGAASFFRAARGYVDYGHRVTVLMPGTPGEPGSTGQPAQERYHGMHLVRVPMRYDPMLKRTGGPIGFARRVHHYLYYYGKVSRAGLRLTEEFRPDVVIALGAHSAQVARRIGVARGIPNVTRLFGQSLSLRMDQAGRIRDRRRFFANFPEVIAFRTPCSVLICHDDGSRGDLVAGYFRVPQDRFYFWRDGFDIPEPCDPSQRRRFKETLRIAPDRVLALSLGRLVVEKGLERILVALERVSDVAPNLDVAFVGDGPARNGLERQSREAGLTDRVHFRSAVRRDELHKIFGATDFLVSTCDRTNMTNATVEGMAAGVPAVALDTGATSAVIHHEETGILVPPGDLSALDRGLMRLALDAALRERLGQQARAFVARNFPRVDERVRREVELVASLVAQGNGVAEGKAADQPNRLQRRPKGTVKA